MIVPAFIFNGETDWRKSVAEDWNFDIVQLDGTEVVIGHRKIDGAIFKILQNSDGKIVAYNK